MVKRLGSDELNFNIREIAGILQVTPATLRNWERQGLFRARRGPNNYRIYNFDDIEKLKLVTFLMREQKVNAAGTRNLLSASYVAQKSIGTGVGKYSKAFLSEKWKISREELGHTLEEVSEGTGLSPSYLSKIENGNANPSLEVLKTLAEFYHKNILYFFQSTTEAKHVTPDNREAVDIGVAGVAIQSLVGVRRHVMEPMLFRVSPGQGITTPHAHEGEEFLYVLQGNIDIIINATEIYRLQSGDSLYFRSRETHQWSNPAQAPAEILWVHVPLSQG